MNNMNKRINHHLSNTPIYNSWQAMKSRCLNKNMHGYQDYGGRGITICEKWMRFLGFLEDMGETFREGLTLDRIDTDGDYTKENCRWATKLQQNNNRRNTIVITLKGETHNLYQWSKIVGVSYTALLHRYRSGGYTPEECLTIPKNPSQYRHRI